MQLAIAVLDICALNNTFVKAPGNLYTWAYGLLKWVFMGKQLIVLEEDKHSEQNKMVKWKQNSKALIVSTNTI